MEIKDLASSLTDDINCVLIRVNGEGNDQYYNDLCRETSISVIDVKLMPALKFHQNNKGIFYTGYNKVQNQFIRIRNFFRRLHNFYLFGVLLGGQDISVVVGSSDLGEGHHRHMYEWYHILNIPFLIYYNFDVKPEKNDIHYNKSSIAWNRFRIVFFRFLRSEIIPAKAELPGSYSLNATVCVNSESVYSRLKKESINENKPILVKSQDLHTSSTVDKTTFYQRTGVPVDNKLIVLYTECLQEIYGDNYCQQIYKRVAEQLKKLINIQSRISIIIKPHPREPREKIKYLQKYFQDIGTVIQGEVSTEEVMLRADVNVGHYSKVLIDASLIGKNILSINEKRERKRTFINEEEATYLELEKVEEMSNTLQKYLNDDEYIKNVKLSVGNISRRYSSDGDNTINDVINNFLKTGCFEV